VPDPSPRRRRILFALCRAYIASGRPVASATLTRHLECSSATIRNELAALEEHGLLHQPHQSAGRVPTAAGMRLYVQALGALPPPSAGVRHAVDVSLRELVHGPEAMRAATQVLSELVGCVAVTFVATGRRGVVRQVDLVPVQGARALVVATLGDGGSLVHPVTLDMQVAGDPSGVVRLQERLRWLCSGKTLEEARADLTRLWHEHETRLDRLLAESLRLGLWLCTAIAFEPLWVQIAGQRLLAGQGTVTAVPLPGGTLAQMLTLFDDYHSLADLLCQLLPEPVGAPRVEVHVGTPAEAGDAEARPGVPAGLSLVGCRVQPADDPRIAAVAMLGPDRMDYESVIPLVEYAAQALAARASE
jgi:heat-inducible transcriptional repressor